MIGQTLDRYMVESKLGEGGMGVVYRARDTQLDRLVAIKVLPHERVADPERKHRFAQEAKAASALNHPGIVTIYDISSDAGIDFMVMEYVRGRTLDSIIPSKRIGITQALRYAAQMADALAAAHDAGIIHRDLKPSNVVVTDDDRVKILDFGLAKLLEPAGGAEDRTRTAPLTEAGLVVGTVAYMSPEQAEGRKVDGRSDIFSFGSMLYEMVTGRRPFAGESSLSTLARIVNDDPTAPSQIVPAVSSDVERAILRCLRKDPARRFQTMADLKVALEDLAADSADPRAPHVAAPGRDRPWRRWTWTAVIPIVLAAGYGSRYAMRTRDSSAPLRAVPLTSLPGAVRNPSLAPDGNHVAFTWSGAQKDNPDVYVQQIGAGSPLRLTTDPANDYSPVWSPDGQSIAFLRQGSDPRHSELRLVPPLGGSERKLADIRPNAAFLRPVTLGWCPDSSCIAVTDAQNGSISDAIVVVAVDTGQKRQLTFPPANVLADTDPVISPDGRWLAFRRDIAPFTGQLELQGLGAGVTATGDPQPLTTITMGAYGPGWMPDSREMVFSAKGALWRVGIAAGSTPQRLPFVGEDGVMPVVSRGTPGTPLRLVYVRSFADSNIWRVGTDGPGTAATAPPAVAISSTRSDGIPNLSPDGQRLVFTSDRSGELEMWLADIDGGHPVQLTTMGLIPGFGRWSPDGGTIVFHSNPENHGDVLAVAADGGKPRNLTPGPRNGTFPSFSRDGRWIYFSAFRDGTVALWKIPASGGEPVRVSTAPGSLAIESTDGANLYYVNSRTTDRPGTLVQQSLASGTVVNLIDNVVSTSFDVIAQGIFYIERLGNESQLKFYAFSTRKAMVVASNLGQLFFGLTASRDGRSIFYSRIDSSVDDLMLVENFR